MSVAAWAVVIGITLIIELYLVWRIVRALRTGTIRVDPLFWIADTWGLDYDIDRADNPILFWLSTAFVVAVAVGVLALFATIVVANLR